MAAAAQRDIAQPWPEVTQCPLNPAARSGGTAIRHVVPTAVDVAADQETVPILARIGANLRQLEILAQPFAGPDQIIRDEARPLRVM